MRIVYFYQYFSTPDGSWGTRVYEFTKEWCRQGHDVTVVTAIYSKSDLATNKIVESRVIDGINVKILNVRIDNTQSFFKRVLSFLSYSLLSSYFALVLRADIVIASSGPITVGIPGLVARYLRRRKLVFEVRDLWPDGAVELGVLQNPFLKKIAYWFERRCYSASSFIITLSPGMTENIQRRFGIRSIDDVTNGANISLFSETHSETKTSLIPKSYAVYTGNIGVVNNSYWLYHAARELQTLGRKDILIVLIGEGPQRKELEERAKIEGVTNFICLRLMPKKDIVNYVRNSFVSLVPLNGTPILGTSSPNKFFESLAAGIPVIQNTNGWMKTFLNDSRSGVTIDGNDAGQLAKTLIRMKDNPAETSAMGLAGAAAAKQLFDKNYLARKMLNILVGVCGTP